MRPFQRFPLYRVTVIEPSGPVDLITFVSPEEIDRIGGVPPEVIVGQLLGPGTDLVPGNFARHRAFVDFMHEVIRTAAPQIEELAAAAKRQRTGWLHIHDARAFNRDPEVAAHDIIGSFRVEDGEIIASSYEANPGHRILSEDGMFTPHPEIQDRLLAAMRDLRFKPETTQ